MMIGRAFSFGLILLLGAGCSDNKGTNPDGSVAGDAARDGSIAPKQLVRDKAKECPSQFQATSPKEGLNSNFVVDGQPRSFMLRLPDSSKFSGPRPLMVYFHGTNGSSAEISTGERKSWADRLLEMGYVVVAPDGADNGTVWVEWDAMRAADDRLRKNRDVMYFDDLVDCLAGHFAVDANRIYVGGHSAGGIMTNRILRERSELLAGGIVASGIYDLTDPVTPGPLKPMAVMVTWGGDNDEYSGTSGGKTVPKINFVEQASVASKAYEAAPGVDQVYCKGDNLGHTWLTTVEDVMADYLATHPKGLSINSQFKLRTPASGSKVTCSDAAAEYKPPVTVTCTKNVKDTCQVYCQSLGDCVVENGTVQPILADQLAKIGFSGTHDENCSGCITNCEADAQAGGAVDDAVLTCYQTESQKKPCGTGITGATTVAEYINVCCKDKLTSKVCQRICQAIKLNTVAAPFFTSCAAF